MKFTLIWLTVVVTLLVSGCGPDRQNPNDLINQGAICTKTFVGKVWANRCIMPDGSIEWATLSD